MKFETLLAKSHPKDVLEIRCYDYAKLYEHLRAVEIAGQTIFANIGAKVLHQLDLIEDVWLVRLKAGLHVACLSHDIGKANDHFQKMVRNEISPLYQAARHELLSALLLADENGEVRKWALSELRRGNSIDDEEILLVLLNCVIGAVAGHHLKLDANGEKASQFIRNNGSGSFGGKIQMFLTHGDLNPLFGEFLTKEVVISLDELQKDSFQKQFYSFVDEKSLDFEDELKSKHKWRRFAAALKALTAAADVAGSALVEGEKDVFLKNWIDKNLSDERFVTTEMMNKVVEFKLKNNFLRDFQKAIADSEARVGLVEAGCGTGKTLAAYKWAANHADGKKLFFCYPTTGTASEGFKDYVYEPEGVEAELMHSRAIADLKDLAFAENDQEKEDAEKLTRVDSLKMWYPQVIVCTTDTVLALPRNNRRGIYGSPAILTASFVFDELHAYDETMLEAVVALINALPNAHFLLMTASLPKNTKDFLFEKIADIKEIEKTQDLIDLENLPRYIFKQLDKEKAVEIANRAFADNKKLLWICNTVERTQVVFDELKAADDESSKFPIHLYHSRFKYEDRKKHHQNVVNQFKSKSKIGVIAVTTQVAEMSLDLDADILISEIAPVPAMIQRLGRLNRRITVENVGEPRNAYFYRNEKDVLPYKTEELDAGGKWIKELIALSESISQEDLSDQFKNLVEAKELELNLSVGWLDSGWCAEPESIRDANNSVSIILKKDEGNCRDSSEELINKTIPMNYDKRMEHWKDYKGNLIDRNDEIEYDEKRGAKWRSK